MSMSGRRRLVVIGAAGRDFHNFNVVFRDDPFVEVVAFTAAQIPGIEGRVYPPELAGRLYPDGIPILDEAELGHIIREQDVDEAVFSYSDLSHDRVMQIASVVNAAGARFTLLSPTETMIRSKKPVVAVCAVRTGCGKSQTSREVCRILQGQGHRVVPIRHPMPYDGDLNFQRCQRFGTIADLTAQRCTIEEMEEYEPHIAEGRPIFAGVDFGDILAEAEKEADVIVWDGGNNDASFYLPDWLIVVVDPLRMGHELTYYPGFINLLMANVVIINKVDSAVPEDVFQMEGVIKKHNPSATIIMAESPVVAEQPELIKGKRVLVVEDGPTCTHGGMKTGAGTVAAKKYGAAKVVDPRPYLQGSLKGTFETYPEIGQLLPAMGYGDEQMADLRATIQAAVDSGEVDTVVVGTPIDLRRVVEIPGDSVRVTYSLKVVGEQTLGSELEQFAPAAKA